jgi:CheY-like chemotaxis protein
LSDVTTFALPCVPRRVLLVEDDIDLREMFRLSLMLDGHDVHVAEDGVDGLDLATRIDPDIVISDLSLPGLNGYQLAQRLRALWGTRDKTLIALTGYTENEVGLRVAEAGFDAHLTKPVEADTLRQLVASSPPVAASTKFKV